MQHRHLNHSDLTLPAIDDVIARGGKDDWAQLRLAVLGDKAVLEKVAGICKANIDDAHAQRYHFWHHYVQAHRPVAKRVA